MKLCLYLLNSIYLVCVFKFCWVYCKCQSRHHLEFSPYSVLGYEILNGIFIFNMRTACISTGKSSSNNVSDCINLCKCLLCKFLRKCYNKYLLRIEEQNHRMLTLFVTAVDRSFRILLSWLSLRQQRMRK